MNYLWVLLLSLLFPVLLLSLLFGSIGYYFGGSIEGIWWGWIVLIFAFMVWVRNIRPHRVVFE